MAVREPELVRASASRAPSARDDERAHEDRRPVAAVGAGVHPDAAARRAGNRARELEAAEPGGSGAVQADGVRRAAARDEQCRRRPRPRRARPRAAARAPRRRRRRRGGSSRARPSRRGSSRSAAQASACSSSASGPGLRECREPARRCRSSSAARAGRPRSTVDHSASSSARPARSTSPAPRVRTTSPGRAQPATSRAPPSSSGAQPARSPRRQRVHDELPRHARHGLLARRIDRP